MPVLDITNIIRDCPDWSLNVLQNRPYWGNLKDVNGNSILVDVHGNERITYGVYLKISIGGNFDVFDNNQNPNVVIFNNHYSIKFGKFENGIINRRRLDFFSHYHTRNGINHNQQLIRDNPNQAEDLTYRLYGSTQTILHLVIETEDNLGARAFESHLRRVILNHPPTYRYERIGERIHIPFNAFQQGNLINNLTRLFNEFEYNMREL